MSEKVERNTRFIGKIRGISFQNGGMKDVLYVDNNKPLNEDGTPNKYHKGYLVWIDNETQEMYEVLQVDLFVPRSGMPEQLVEKGFKCYATLDLNSKYSVKKKE